MTLLETYKAKHIRFDHHPDGFGIGTSRPRLSWRYSSGTHTEDGEEQTTPTPTPGPRWAQKGYFARIRIFQPGTDPEDQVEGQVEVASGSSLFEPWPTKKLRSRERALVHVMAYNSTTTPWADLDTEYLGDDMTAAEVKACFTPSQPMPHRFRDWAPVEAGLLEASDWQAKFITSPDPPSPEGVPHRPTIYRKVFAIPDKQYADEVSGSYARLYISALGLYEAFINGKRVGDHHMAPGWTSYHHRVPCQTHDVSDLLKSGENVITVEVAEGWYAGRLLWIPGLRNLYGDKPAFIAQLEIHHAGTTQVVSDDTWTCHPSPRQSASIYDGEVYDAREELTSIHSPTFEEPTAWQKAGIFPFDFKNTALISTDAPPVRITEVVKPIKIVTSPSGATLVDFGQNLVGAIRIRGLAKPAGHSLTIRHAEVLENNELCTRPLRNAKATDTYIFSGAEPSHFEWAPQFTFHGFRYIELTGWSPSDPIPPSADTLAALVLGTDLQRTGTFTTSHPLLNKLHQNVVWSMRGNFLAVPTDCPQRDERLGWTGDIQVFAPTALFLYASAGFLTNWLRDLSIDQAALNGTVPVVIPDVLHGRLSQNDAPVAVWDDAAILVPWATYRASSDAAILHNQFPSMEAHLRNSIQRDPATGLWDPALFQYGDWLDPNAPADNAALARTDGTLVADAYLCHVTAVTAQVAVVIGNAAAARSYQAEADALKRAFRAKYVAPSGLVVGDSQTALALAIVFGLLATPEQVRVAGERLARQVRAADFRVATGFAGTPLVLRALTATGSVALAYEMILCEGCPSWLYPVTMGSSTIWERWDSMLPDGRVNPGEMTSFNHYALGSVAEWLHEVVGGVEMMEAGWRTFRVRPRPGGGLVRGHVGFEGPLGFVGCTWEVVGGRFVEGARVVVLVTVPVGARAWVVMPGQEDEDGVWKGCGRHEMESLLDRSIAAMS